MAETKTTEFHMRLTPTEKALLQAAAKRHGLKPTQLVRKLILTVDK